MNLAQVLCHPIGWSEKICSLSIDDECKEIIPYLKGSVVEVFCRGGMWGTHLINSGIDWSGMDPNAEILERAFLHGIFSVSVDLFPSKKSCNVIFGAMAPFSLISSEDLPVFVQGLYDALQSEGSVLLSLWEDPNCLRGKPNIYTHNGREKVVMACVSTIVGSVVWLDMDWMVAREGEEPFYVQHREKRYLHFEEDICRECQEHFARIEILNLAGRRWLFAKKS